MLIVANSSFMLNVIVLSVVMLSVCVSITQQKVSKTV